VVDRSGEAQALLARLRWQHPHYGWIEQTETLQAAGRAGLVADVELWQICEACEYLHAQRGASPPAILAVSGWQLRDREFVAHLLQLFDRYRVPGSALVLALTPDGLAEAVDRHPDAQRLVERGLRFALRDFNRMPARTPLPLSYALAAPAQFDVALPAGVSAIAIGVDDTATLQRARAAAVDLFCGSVVSRA
jgi:EAL domain-containing protein (putative c-di-GMP-specific phosphodiesterase class I)